MSDSDKEVVTKCNKGSSFLDYDRHTYGWGIKTACEDCDRSECPFEHREEK